MDGILLSVMNTVRLVGPKGVGYVVGVIVGIVYFVYLEGGPTGRTLGIRVVSFDTGGPIGYPRAFIRYVGRIIDFVVLRSGRVGADRPDRVRGQLVVPALLLPVRTASTGRR